MALINDIRFSDEFELQWNENYRPDNAFTGFKKNEQNVTKGKWPFPTDRFFYT